MQVVTHLAGDRPVQLLLPPADALAIDHVPWGRHDELCSPAYWAAQSWMWEIDEPNHFRLGRTLREEVLACMLGGYGIPAEVGLAAYARLRPFADEFSNSLCEESFVRDELTRPLSVEGRTIHYRFPKQKARLVTGAFRSLNSELNTLADRPLRDALTKLSGIGPKTASWIVRNLRGSDEVAILDVHLLRAGRMLGIFRNDLTVEKHYMYLEEAFLRFSTSIRTRSSILDSVMWMTMRQLPRQIIANMVAATCHDTAAQIMACPLERPRSVH